MKNLKNRFWLGACILALALGSCSVRVRTAGRFLRDRKNHFLRDRPRRLPAASRPLLMRPGITNKPLGGRFAERIPVGA